MHMHIHIQGLAVRQNDLKRNKQALTSPGRIMNTEYKLNTPAKYGRVLTLDYVRFK